MKKMLNLDNIKNIVSKYYKNGKNILNETAEELPYNLSNEIEVESNNKINDGWNIIKVSDPNSLYKSLLLFLKPNIKNEEIDIEVKNFKKFLTENIKKYSNRMSFNIKKNVSQYNPHNKIYFSLNGNKKNSKVIFNNIIEKINDNNNKDFLDILKLIPLFLQCNIFIYSSVSSTWYSIGDLDKNYFNQPKKNIFLITEDIIHFDLLKEKDNKKLKNKFNLLNNKSKINLSKITTYNFLENK